MVDHRIAAGGRVVAGEIPVAAVAFDRGVEVVDVLENHLHFAVPLNALRIDHPADFRGNLLIGERLVNRLDAVPALGGGPLELRLAVIVNAVEQRLPARPAVQRDGGGEGDELAELRHVDAVTIRITDLRRGGADDDLRRLGAGEDFENRLLERGAADDRVVQCDEEIPRFHDAVGDVVNVGNHLVAAFFLRDEGPHLDVLVRDFLAPRPVAEDQIIDQLGREGPITRSLEDFRAHFLAAVEAEAVHQPVIRRFCGVRNEGEDRLVKRAADGLDDLRYERGTHRLPLAINLRVVASGEIDLLKRARRVAPRRREGRVGYRAVRLDGDHRSGIDCFHLAGVCFEHGHQRHPLGREGDDLVGY